MESSLDFNTKKAASSAALFVLLASILFAPTAIAFERVPALEGNVAFFRNVYAKWSRNNVIYHDPVDLTLVYRVVRVPARGTRVNGLSRKEVVAIGKVELVKALKSLEQKQPRSAKGLTGVEKEVYENLAHIKRVDKYSRASKIRLQTGLMERSRQGWVNFGRYERDVKRELRRGGMPEELIALAFLESLYNIRARSPSNALGMWQFLEGTAKEYMNAHEGIDERIDPVLATEAATKYLTQSRKELGAWPLAITSYNIGRAGMARGVRETGSRDLGHIVKNYKYRTFGFAARNYYATFLAMTDVINNPDHFFPGVQREKPWEYDIVALPFGAKVPTLLKAGVVKRSDLELLNPALSTESLDGTYALSVGFNLRVPKGSGAKARAAFEKIPPKTRKLEATPIHATHTANGKQSIFRIARLYKTDPDIVSALNGRAYEEVPFAGTPVSIPAPEALHYTSFPEVRNDREVPAEAIRVVKRSMPKVREVPEVLIDSGDGPAALLALAAMKAAPAKVEVPGVVLSAVHFTPLPQSLPAVDFIAGAASLGEIDALLGAPFKEGEDLSEHQADLEGPNS